MQSVKFVWRVPIPLPLSPVSVIPLIDRCLTVKASIYKTLEVSEMEF